MLSLNAGQLALVADDSKIIRWSFTVTDINSTVYTYITDNAAGSNIVIMDFSGISLRRNMAENTIIAPSDVSFSISNPSNTMAFTDFKGGSVLIELYLSTDGTTYTKISGWKFRIKTAQPEYQKLKITAEDFLQHYLTGYYPNTRLPEEIFPSNRTYPNEGTCVPVPFGTAYVPLRDVFIQGGETGITWDTGISWDTGTEWVAAGGGSAGYLVLGDPGLTYTITKIRNPRSTGLKSEWSSASYDFTQYTKTDVDSTYWRVFKAVIADVNNDGTADAHGFWGTPGGPILDPPVEFTRSDTATMTNPADIIEFVLKDMGIPAAMIDATTFGAAETVYTGWGLEFNGAFWYKQPREKVLATLLTQCHSCLQVGETIQLKVLYKASQKTITGTEVLRNIDQGEGTFSYRDIVNSDLSDACYIAWQTTGEAQDAFLKTLVAADGSTATVISGDVIECPFVQGSQDVKRIGTLAAQRKFLKEGETAFTAKSHCLALQPDDVITLNSANYGGSYAVLIDSVQIGKDLSIKINASKYSSAFSDWADVSPAAVVLASDDTTKSWQPVISGPDDPYNTNVLPGRIRIGETADYILLDPNGPLRVSVYDDGTEVFRAGNLNGFLGYASDVYGIAIGDLTNYLKYDAVNGLEIDGTVTIEGGVDWADVTGTGKPSDNADVTLSAINGGLVVTGGGITLSSGGSIKAGQTDYATGTGFFLGYSGSAYKFSVGDSDEYMKWDGSTLEVTRISVTEPTTEATDSVTGLSVTDTATIYIRTGVNDNTYPWTAVSNKTHQGRAIASGGYRNAGHNMCFWQCYVDVVHITGFEVSGPNYVTWEGDDWYEDDLGLKVTLISINYIADDEITDINWAIMAV